nr:hypothetical protein [Sedimentibacter sp.]
MKGIIFSTVILLVVLLIGFSTNPSYEDYKEWYKTESYEEVEASTKIEKSVVGFVSGLVADSTVVREDYKVLSLYTVENDDYTYKVLGIFNNFFVIENDEIPVIEQ